MSRNPYFIGINSAIPLIHWLNTDYHCRNPYFIGINSAINQLSDENEELKKSQSLFYWN